MVSTQRVFPKSVSTRVQRFTPLARPNVAQVHRLIRLEADRAHVSAARLSRRVACESTYRWFEEYAGHAGLLQFIPSTYRRGVASLTSRKVVIRHIVRRRLHTRLVTSYSDGTSSTRLGYRVRVKRRYVRLGWLPRHPGLYHAHVQLRIGAEAMAGRSAVSDSEWSCRG